MHTWMITFRPFLMFHVLWKRANMLHPEHSDVTHTRLPHPDIAWLQEASEVAVDQSRKLINFTAAVMDVNPIMKVRAYAIYLTIILWANVNLSDYTRGLLSLPPTWKSHALS